VQDRFRILKATTQGYQVKSMSGKYSFWYILKGGGTSNMARLVRKRYVLERKIAVKSLHKIIDVVSTYSISNTAPLSH
jgi:hypothetical protein